MITIKKEIFTLIVKRLALLSKQVNEMEAKFGNKNLEGLLSSTDVCDILHIKPRTLQTYRDTGKISFSQIGRKIYYRKCDIEEFFNKNESINKSLNY